jgi:hypothetical protein
MKLAQQLTEINLGLLGSLHVGRLKDQGLEVPSVSVPTGHGRMWQPPLLL